MKFCNLKSKATLTLSTPDHLIISSKSTPLVVNVQAEIETVSGSGYTSYYDYRFFNADAGASFSVTGILIYDSPFTARTDKYILYDCQGSVKNSHVSVTPGSIQVMATHPCPGSTSKTYWNFSVKDGNNIAIYSKKFDKEPVYTVACDEDCPAGYCKCPTVKYPGYCCLPCSSTAQKINNLANRIRV